MNGQLNTYLRATAFVTMLLLLSASRVFAQGSAFTYQGRLQDGGTLANGNYDFQFTLWDAFSAGTQQPQPGPITVTRSGLQVANGVFTTQLDFGGNAFPGANRFLEISVRLAGGGSFTVLSPRQQITGTPYAIRSASAASSDVAASAVSANNATHLNGIAADQYVLTSDSRLSDWRPPAAGYYTYIQNIGANSQAQSASFNISGSGYIGGRVAIGTGNVTLGQLNVDGGNQFAAITAWSTSGLAGYFIGKTVTTGNLGVGEASPTAKIHVSGTGVVRARVNSDSNAGVGLALNEQSKWSLATVTGGSFQIFNDANGQNALWIDTNNNVGIGTTAPTAQLHVNAGSETAIYGVSTSGMGVYGASSGGYAGYFSGNVHVSGTLQLINLAAAGSETLCRNSNSQLATCSSSLRYKTNVQAFAGGLNIINRLRPITFDWKQSGARDIGLGAEEVANVAPLLVTRNTEGEIEGVKYDRLSAVFINAFKEQQEQIRQQQSRIEQQAQQIESLKQLVCLDHPQAKVCK